MLILRRKKNESILIGENIRITVVESAGDGVRLAIDAPRSLSILREELSSAEEINRSAVSPAVNSVLTLQSTLRQLAESQLTKPQLEESQLVESRPEES
jgi:carbon storage regulator